MTKILKLTKVTSLLVFLLCFPAIYSPAMSASAVLDDNYGVYDPEGTFGERDDIKIEHIFMPWEDVELDSLFAAEDYTSQRNRILLVTIEPWTWSRDERNTADFLIKNIKTGLFDPNMATICRRLNELKVPVIVRWAHEMDNSEGQFIWSGWEPQVYINAYRRFIGVCRKNAPSVKYMWSPLGDPNMADYYPGDDYVDYIGLTVFGLQEFDADNYSRDRSFNELTKPGYEIAKDFRKPVCIAELGYLGDEKYMTDWYEEVQSGFATFPKLECIVYFNQQEVYPWPDGYGLPDWRIEQDKF